MLSEHLPLQVWLPVRFDFDFALAILIIAALLTVCCWIILLISHAASFGAVHRAIL